MDLVSFISSVPVAVWSGLVGTFGGVILSNWGNSARLDQQLKHDAQVKSQERTASLRKEVYLEAAKKMPAALSALVDSSNNEETFTVNANLSEFFAVGAQMQLVAEPVTAALVNDLVLKYNDLLMKSSFFRSSFHSAVIELNRVEKERDIAISESERVLGELKKIDYMPNADSNLRDALLGARDHRVAIETDANLKCLKAEQKVIVERFKLLKLLLPDVKEVSELQVKVLVGIRQDLGLSSDVKLLELQAKKQIAVMENLMRFLDDLIEKHLKNT